MISELILRVSIQIWLQTAQRFLKQIAHHFDLIVDHAQIGIFLANEAQNERVDVSRHVHRLIMLNVKGLQFVFVESFVAKFVVFVAYLGQDGRLTVQIHILTRFRND